VSTTVFHWYTSTGGQLTGPWRPAEGRSNWTGEPAFWQDQIKQMMSANVDVLYVHLIPHMEEQRVNLFQALNQLRAQGYDVPKVAPFLDPPITWDGRPPVNLATPAGKDEFVGHYIRFFDQYYSANNDELADSYLAQMNGRVQLDTWHVHLNTLNWNAFSRPNVESRLTAVFGAEHPVFNNGIYMLATAHSPTFTFIDEVLTQFEVNDYLVVTSSGGFASAQIKPGYWDQNIRNPGSILKRDGGGHYEDAWEEARTNLAIKHINIESWNEYDEGSGIYRANAGAPYIRPGSGNPSTDDWSTTDNELEYVESTANGARQYNSVPDRDARILWHNLPARMRPGEEGNFQVVVRNDGDLSWTELQQFRFGQQEFLPGETLFGPGRYLLDDSENEIGIYGGIFRGRPVTFDVHLTAPETPGTYLTHWSMLQEHVTWFGQLLTLPITVASDGDYDVNGIVDAADYVAWRKLDGDQDGYSQWRTNFGVTSAAGANAPGVPEPTSALLIAAIGCLGATTRLSRIYHFDCACAMRGAIPNGMAPDMGIVDRPGFDISRGGRFLQDSAGGATLQSSPSRMRRAAATCGSWQNRASRRCSPISSRMTGFLRRTSSGN
jgi:hypothetical protein